MEKTCQISGQSNINMAGPGWKIKPDLTKGISQPSFIVEEFLVSESFKKLRQSQATSPYT